MPEAVRHFAMVNGLVFSAVAAADLRGASAASPKMFTFMVDELGGIRAAFEPTLDAALGAEAARFELLRRAEAPLGMSRRPSLPMSPERGSLIDGRFRLRGHIATGGMGEVWRAEHVHLGRDVALKFLKERLDENGKRRFRFEAQALAAISSATPHVVLVLDAGESEAGPFLSMELVEGRALDEELAENGPMTPDGFLVVLEQLGAALSAAHAAGVIHRDVKPENVLVSRTPDGRPFIKLTDFGAAKPTEAAHGFDCPKDTSPMLLFGTPEYMSPERLRGGRAHPTMDVRALGVIAYEALTGALPFRGGCLSQTILSIEGNEPRPMSDAQATLPRELDTWIALTLAKEPDRRFASVAATVEAYRVALSAAAARGWLPEDAARSPVSSFEAKRTLRVGPAHRPRRAAPVAAATLVGLVVVGFGALALSPNDTARGKDSEARPLDDTTVPIRRSSAADAVVNAVGASTTPASPAVERQPADRPTRRSTGASRAPHAATTIAPSADAGRDPGGGVP